MYVKVLVGKPFEMASEPNGTESVRDEELRNPPDGYDSVKARTAETDCYMIYSDANIKTYPMFMVYYKWED